LLVQVGCLVLFERCKTLFSKRLCITNHELILCCAARGTIECEKAALIDHP
jgi:hypothetical protein